MQKYKLILFIIVTILFQVPTLHASICTSQGDGDWDDPTIWSCGRVPTSSDDVRVRSNDQINLDVNAGVTITVASITLLNSGSNGGVLTIDGVDLTVTGDLTIDNHADFIIQGSANVVINGSLIWDNNGNIDVDGAGSGGTLLVHGCADGPGNADDPANIIGGVNLDWCVGTSSSCTTSNSGQSSNGGCGILPVTLIYFRAIPNKNTVDLLWATASEENNEYFTIEKSTNGIDFFSVTDIDGAGTTQTMIKYQYTDQSEFTNITYYRLKQTNTDGSHSYSKTTQVLFDNIDESIKLYPNPITDSYFTIDSFNAKKMSIVVYDLRGKQVHVDQSNELYSWGIKGVFRFKQDISGVYIVSIQTENGITQKKVYID